VHGGLDLLFFFESVEEEEEARGNPVEIARRR
jgi:hypothetical protein